MTDKDLDDIDVSVTSIKEPTRGQRIKYTLLFWCIIFGTAWFDYWAITSLWRRMTIDTTKQISLPLANTRCQTIECILNRDK